MCIIRVRAFVTMDLLISHHVGVLSTGPTALYDKIVKNNDQHNQAKPIEASWEQLFRYCGIHPSSLKTFERKIGHRFNDLEPFYQALSHRSALVAYHKFCQAKGIKNKISFSCYERIEFLGDAVLGLAISSMLWKIKTSEKKLLTEGELSRVKAFLISEKTLAKFAKNLDLNRYIALSSSEKAHSGSKRTSLLADCLEALIGAIYVDGGYEAAEKFLTKLYKKTLKQDLLEISHDYKSRLQEIIQGQEKEAPHYEMLEAVGPDHAKSFRVGVYTNNKKLASAWGASKKKASQEAAKQALVQLAKTQKPKERQVSK